MANFSPGYIGGISQGMNASDDYYRRQSEAEFQHSLYQEMQARQMQMTQMPMPQTLTDALNQSRGGVAYGRFPIAPATDDPRLLLLEAL